jgi:hypothetical protein
VLDGPRDGNERSGRFRRQVVNAGKRVVVGERVVERSDTCGQFSYLLFLGLPDRTGGQKRAHHRDVKRHAVEVDLCGTEPGSDGRLGVEDGHDEDTLGPESGQRATGQRADGGAESPRSAYAGTVACHVVVIPSERSRYARSNATSWLSASRCG